MYISIYIYIYMGIYIYIWVYIYIYMYIYIHIYIYIDTYICLYICTCIYLYRSTCIHILIYAFIHTHVVWLFLSPLNHTQSPLFFLTRFFVSRSLSPLQSSPQRTPLLFTHSLVSALNCTHVFECIRAHTHRSASERICVLIPNVFVHKYMLYPCTNTFSICAHTKVVIVHQQILCVCPNTQL